PVSFGDQRSMTAPCGKPTKANRFAVEPAAVCAQAVEAGLIASRSGNAMLAPMPFNTARRETCFLLLYISCLLYLFDWATVAGWGARRILNCSLRTTLCTSAENL